MPIGSAKIGVLGAGTVPGGTQTFNASGTFTVPPGVTRVNITGKGGTGNPGNAGAAGNPGNPGTGAGGGGSFYGNTPGVSRGGSAFNPGPPADFNNPNTITPRAILGGLTTCPAPVCANWSGTAPSGTSGNAGNAGQAGNPGNPGNTGNASSGLNYNFAGGAGGNAGAAGNAGTGGSGGSGGGGAVGTRTDSAGNGGAGGNSAGSGGQSIRQKSGTFEKYGLGKGGGGAGTVNAGTSGTSFGGNSCNAWVACNSGGLGGTDPSLPCLGPFDSGLDIIPQNYPGIPTPGPSAQVLSQFAPTKTIGGFGMVQGAVLVLGSGPYMGCLGPSSFNYPTFGPRYNAPDPALAPAFRAGGGGAPGKGTACISFTGPQSPPSPPPYTQSFSQAQNNGSRLPFLQHSGGGGGGGRGGAGNAGTVSPTPSGSAATPQTFNCVPVTPGSPYPITVASPGGQIVISWNPQ